MKKIKITALFLTLVHVGTISANELVYHPQNSAFGGSPAATQVLLSKAAAQNKEEDPETQKTEVERFQEQLERSILREISRSVTNTFDDDEVNLTGRSFSSTDFSVHILTDNEESVSLQIESFLDGNVTNLTIPKF